MLNQYAPAIQGVEQAGTDIYKGLKAPPANPMQFMFPDLGSPDLSAIATPMDRMAFLRAFGVQG